MEDKIFAKLKSLHLSAMGMEYLRQIENIESDNLSFKDRIRLLVDTELVNRQSNRLNKLLKESKLRHSAACLEALDYNPKRKLDRGYIASLSECDWIKSHRNLIIIGSTGTGKTYMACAFGNAACQLGFKTRYYRITRLLTDLSIGRGDGTYNQIMQELRKIDVLILDDWGLTMIDPAAGREILEIIEDRSGYRSTVIAGQMPVKGWHGLFADSAVADAVLDRIVHNSYRINLHGPSQRDEDNSTNKKLSDLQQNNLD